MPYVDILCDGSDAYVLVAQHVADEKNAFETALIAGFEKGYQIQYQPSSFRINLGQFDTNAKHVPSIEVLITMKSVGGPAQLAKGGAAFLVTTATHMVKWYLKQFDAKTASGIAFEIPVNLHIALITDGTTMGLTIEFLTRTVTETWGCELQKGEWLV